MNTLLESIKYTEDKKKYQLKNLLESHYEYPKDVFLKFLDNTLKTKSTVAITLEYSSNWDLWKYLENYFGKEDADFNLLARSTKKGYLSNFLRYLIGLKSPKYTSHVLLRIATMHLGQMLFLGWDQKCIKYGNLLLLMLTDKYYKGGTALPLCNWFILSLFCEWQNLELKKNDLNIPKDLGIYQLALDNIYSRDIELIDQIIENLTTYHIENSDEYSANDEYGNEKSAEFCNSNYFIFPIEILMFLSIRKRLGLPDYDVAKNELLSLPINKIPRQAIIYPQHDIIDEIFDKLYLENPDYPRL